MEDGNRLRITTILTVYSAYSSGQFQVMVGKVWGRQAKHLENIA